MTTSLHMWVHGLSVLGPGLTDWQQARAVLSGQEAYVPAAAVLPATSKRSVKIFQTS